MASRLFTILALSMSLGLGVGTATLWSIVSAANDNPGSATSITGVNSGSSGSDATEDEQEGVESVPPDTVSPPPSPTVTIEGVQGTEGTTTVPQDNTVEGVQSVEGSVEPIRGIEGIDAVMMQNLEAVLRMQQRPEEREGQGGVSTAAGLMMMDEFLPTDDDPLPDGREELMEFELEGS
ncbi:MAG TPA: hypothetical protein VE890_11870 [Thermoguttaceae bacterium]|nr:hypothetical protein [Thermoguttaceae bacterium]